LPANRIRLGAGDAIQGFDDGLMSMCVGERRRLEIPPELAYGEKGRGPIPPNATIVFVVTLEGITLRNPDMTYLYIAAGLLMIPMAFLARAAYQNDRSFRAHIVGDGAVRSGPAKKQKEKHHRL
jgi:hypothetical protein